MKPITNFLVKVCKSGPFAVFFYILFAMQLLGGTIVLFQTGNPVIAVANIVCSVLLLGLYLAVRGVEE